MSESSTQPQAAPQADAPRVSFYGAVALAFLAVMFAAGLALVYGVDTLLPQGTDEAAAPATAAVAEPPTAVATAPAAVPSTDAVSAEIAALRDDLSASRSKLENLERDLARLQNTQTERFDAERKALHAHLSELMEAQRAELAQAQQALQAREQAAQRRRAGYAALNARLTASGALVSLGESELRFAAGQATLPSEESPALRQVADFLTQHPEVRVELRGYTDSSGDDAANLRLSEDRARAVEQALIALGVSVERISTAGRGEADPIASNETPEGRANNRRVEVYLIEG